MRSPHAAPETLSGSQCGRLLT